MQELSFHIKMILSIPSHLDINETCFRVSFIVIYQGEGGYCWTGQASFDGDSSPIGSVSI